MKVLLIGIATPDGVITWSRDFNVPNTRGSNEERVNRQVKEIHHFMHQELLGAFSDINVGIDEIIVVYENKVLRQLTPEHYGDEKDDPEAGNDEEDGGLG
jgi:hypothetical protein